MKARADRALRERIIEAFLFACSSVSLLTTAGIIIVLVVESALFFQNVSLRQFLLDTEWTPLFLDKRFGIWPLVCGTVLTSAIALSLSVPAGLVIAVYLSEFASERSRRLLKPLLEILAGIPTIVYGYFALLFVTPILQLVFPSMGSFNALSAGLVMGIMILPMVASLSEDAIFTVPKSLREGAYALGASKLQMIVGAVLPVETMTAYIVQVSLGDTPHGTLEYHTLFAVAMMLFVLTLALNMVSVYVRDRFKRMFR